MQEHSGNLTKLGQQICGFVAHPSYIRLGREKYINIIKYILVVFFCDIARELIHV